MTRSGDEVLLGIRALASFAVGYGTTVTLGHGDTPGPYLVFAALFLALPYLLAGTALALDIGMAVNGGKRGYPGIVVVVAFVAGTVAALGGDAMCVVVFGLPALALGAGIGALVCWVANDDPVSRRQSTQRQPER